jgi:hypothetical protein
MTRLVWVLTIAALALVVALDARSAAAGETERSPYAAWEKGPPADPGYFPIGVWLQSPQNARRYKEAGINLYIGLHQGPTEEDLQTLKAAGMQTICAQNEVGLKHLDDKTIVAWMHGDEPDNCQPRDTYWKNDWAAMREAWPDLPDLTPERWQEVYGNWGPPIPPKRIQADYEQIRRNDPTRPVYLNLGIGVAYDSIGGRGVRAQHPEDYYGYCKGCDVVSYDVYPDRTRGERGGKLWYVPRGVRRLYKYSGGQKIVWNIIEGSRADHVNGRPTPESLRTEAWMSIIHGSRGIIYFVHLFRPSFVEAGVLVDEELLAGMTSLHAEIGRLAPVINSPTVVDGATVVSSVPASEDDMKSDALQPIALMVKRHEGATYLFTVRMEDTPATGRFAVKGLPARATAEVLGEDRTIRIVNGAFSDEFEGYAVHLYKIAAR